MRDLAAVCGSIPRVCTEVHKYHARSLLAQKYGSTSTEAQEYRSDLPGMQQLAGQLYPYIILSVCKPLLRVEVFLFVICDSERMEMEEVFTWRMLNCKK